LKISILSTGSRQEPGIDNVAEWSFPKEGNLEQDENNTLFGDWVIPNTQITEAVLNSENLFIKKRQTLLINCEKTKYVFGFYKPVENDFIFPFEVRVTKRRSFIGKLVLFAVAVLLLSSLWQLFRYLVTT
jgi:hypothetical protein